MVTWLFARLEYSYSIFTGIKKRTSNVTKWVYLQRIICKRARYLHVHPKKIDLTISIPFNQYSILLNNHHSFIVVCVMFVWLLSIDFTIESISIAIKSSKVGALEHHFDDQNTYLSTFYFFVIHTTCYDNNKYIKI